MDGLKILKHLSLKPTKLDPGVVPIHTCTSTVTLIQKYLSPEGSSMLNSFEEPCKFVHKWSNYMYMKREYMYRKRMA